MMSSAGLSYLSFFVCGKGFLFAFFLLVWKHRVVINPELSEYNLKPLPRNIRLKFSVSTGCSCMLNHRRIEKEKWFMMNNILFSLNIFVISSNNIHLLLYNISSLYFEILFFWMMLIIACQVMDSLIFVAIGLTIATVTNANRNINNKMIYIVSFKQPVDLLCNTANQLIYIR